MLFEDIAVVVPYRDRPEQLNRFIPAAIDAYQPRQLIISEQADDKPFNRGRLLNIGMLQSVCSIFVFHDVDMYPNFIFSKINWQRYHNHGVVQLASSSIQVQNYLGGVTLYDKSIFLRSGGYHNDYYSRAEDNEMWFNLKRLRIPVNNLFLPFIIAPHARPAVEFDAELYKKAQIPRAFQNQLALSGKAEIETRKEENVFFIKSWM